MPEQDFFAAIEERLGRLEQQAATKQDIAGVFEHLHYMRYDAKIKALENKVRQLETELRQIREHG